MTRATSRGIAADDEQVGALDVDDFHGAEQALGQARRRRAGAVRRLRRGGLELGRASRLTVCRTCGAAVSVGGEHLGGAIGGGRGVDRGDDLPPGAELVGAADEADLAGLRLGGDEHRGAVAGVDA